MNPANDCVCVFRVGLSVPYAVFFISTSRRRDKTLALRDRLYNYYSIGIRLVAISKTTCQSIRATIDRSC